MKKRETYLDVLRIIAILAVIFMHVSSRVQIHYPDNAEDYFITGSINTATRFAVPLFVMISGALMLGRGLQYRHLCSKIVHFMIVFLSWSLIYTLILNAQYLSTYSLGGLVVNTLIDTITGHFHFWFLFLISGIYISIPYLDVLFKNLNQSLVRRYIYISLLVCFIPNMLLSIDMIDNILGAHYSSFNVGFFGGYLLYFVCGYLLKNWNPTNLKKVFAATNIALVYTVFMFFVADRTHICDVVGIRDGITLNVFIVTVGIFAIAKSIVHINSEKWKHVLQTISELSFGTYLVHMLVLLMLEKLILGLKLNCICTLIIYGCSVTICSFAISYMLSRAKHLKWLVS